MAGLDPAIHPSSENAFMISMDARIKPGHDSVFCIGTSLGHTSPSPRRFCTRAVATSSSLGKSEGAGNAGRSSAPVVLREENTQGFATGSPKTFRHSLRDGLTVSFVVSLVIGLSCHHPRSRCASIVTRLIPASKYQDHTTSPSAFSPLVCRREGVHRVPRPTSVTIAKRPS